MMSGLNLLSIAEARDGLAKKDFTAGELTEDCLRAMEAAEDLNAFVTATPDLARDQAGKSDARRAKGEAKGALDGVPLAIKDLFCTKGILTSAGSRILTGFKPPYESTVTARLMDAGAVMLGKTNLDEFAMGSANVTSCHGPVKSPWGRDKGEDLTPGGSSGGSAAAVSARLCLGAIGTDTGGSIRQPASFTGIVGMKPTYGRPVGCRRLRVLVGSSRADDAERAGRRHHAARHGRPRSEGSRPRPCGSDSKPPSPATSRV